MVHRALPRQVPGAVVGATLTVALTAAIVLLAGMPAIWLVAGGSLAALVLLEPFSAIALMPFAIAFGSLASLSVLHVNIGPTDLLVGALALAWLIELIRGTRSLPMLSAAHLRAIWAEDRTRVLAFLALAAYLLVICISIVVAANRVATIKEMIKWSEVLVVVAIGSVYLRSEARVRVFVWATISAAVAEAILGFAQWVVATGQAGPGGESLRVFGTFEQPNPYGGFLNFGLILALALVIFGRGSRGRWVAAGAGVLLLGAQALANSRGALLGLAVALLTLIVVGWRRERIAALIAAIGIPLAVIGWVAHIIPVRLQQVVLNQLRIGDALHGTINDANFSTVERVAHWIAGARMFAAHPILGVGAGNYDAAYPQYALPEWPDALGHAHNYYVNAAAETGLLGCAAFLALTAVSIGLGWQTVQAIRARFGAHGLLPAVALGLLATLLALAAHNLTDDLFVHAMELQFALTLGCLLALHHISAERESLQ